MNIKSEQYTDEKKAYLTYTPHPTAMSRLLKEKKQDIYHLYLNGIHIQTVNRLTLKAIKSLENSGVIIKKTSVEKHTGANTFTTKKNINIPITVRQIKRNGKLKFIRVRITSPSLDQLMEITYDIRDTLKAYGLKPKICVWDRTGTI